jgi:hypothetical protein
VSRFILRGRWIAVLGILVLIVGISGAAAPTQFAWDPNPAAQGVTSYRVYTCPAAPCSLANGTKIGETPNTTFPIPAGRGAAFVTAVNPFGESAESNVVFFGVPGAVTNFRLQ